MNQPPKRLKHSEAHIRGLPNNTARGVPNSNQLKVLVDQYRSSDRQFASDGTEYREKGTWCQFAGHAHLLYVFSASSKGEDFVHTPTDAHLVKPINPTLESHRSEEYPNDGNISALRQSSTTLIIMDAWSES